MSTIFHLAIPVEDISQTKAFYVDGLGCQIGRESNNALILKFFEHQLVAHVTEQLLLPQKGIYPRHFGIVFSQESDWKTLVSIARENKLRFYQQPKLRFPGLAIEHRACFLEDPFHNLLEFKYYRNPQAIFACRELSQIGDRLSLHGRGNSR